MAIPVLIITPTPGFGDLIYITLRDVGYYQPVLVNTGLGALASARQVSYAAVILDADLEDMELPELVKSLKEILPNMRLIVISSQTGGDRLYLEDLNPQGYLSKPFYLPDLLDKVSDALGENVALPVPSPAPPIEQPIRADRKKSLRDPLQSYPGIHTHTTHPSRPHAPYWLNDVDRVAQHLTRLSLESAAQAALIVRAGQLWAYAGGLSQAAAEELVVVTTRYWEHDGGSDLVRFIHLDATNREYMLYATSLFTDTLLALAFDAETPFGKIRTEASQLARALADPPAKDNSPKTERNEPAPVAVLPETSPAPPNDRATEPDLRQTGPLEAPPENPPDNSPEPQEAALAHTEEPSFILRPATGTVFHLCYACLLIPRLPEHHLTGGLAKNLSTWIPQICVAFDLRLERLSIRPGYMTWMAEVNPNISPDDMVRFIREHTSRRIFEAHRNLALQNPSADFWAPGYLVLSSTQLPPAQAINDFIQQTRERQGSDLPN